jgi:hypothetical protein
MSKLNEKGHHLDHYPCRCIKCFECNTVRIVCQQSKITVIGYNCVGYCADCWIPYCIKKNWDPTLSYVANEICDDK